MLRFHGNKILSSTVDATFWQVLGHVKGFVIFVDLFGVTAAR